MSTPSIHDGWTPQPQIEEQPQPTFPAIPDPEDAASTAVIDALRHLDMLYDEEQQDSDWQNQTAKHLNTLLVRAKWTLETSAPVPGVDMDFAKATLDIVGRVAEFESIKSL